MQHHHSPTVFSAGLVSELWSIEVKPQGMGPRGGLRKFAKCAAPLSGLGCRCLSSDGGAEWSGGLEQSLDYCSAINLNNKNMFYCCNKSQFRAALSQFPWCLRNGGSLMMMMMAITQRQGELQSRMSGDGDWGCEMLCLTNGVVVSCAALIGPKINYNESTHQFSN